jgi:hypothetical protein
MKTKTINLYKFEELTEEQQAKVIDQYSDINNELTCNLITWDDRFIQDLEDKGFINPDISYSLNYRQGDGASFTCSELDYDLLLKDYTGKHKSWMLEILNQYCEVKIERDYSCHYVHERSCDTELYEYTQCNYPRIIDELENIRQYIEDIRLEACINLAEDLQNEIDYLTSDEAIKEALIANEYYFNGETLEIEY